MSESEVLVAGSGGVIGSNVIRELVSQGIQVRGVSRRAPILPAQGWGHIAADLLDPDSAMQALTSVSTTTDLVFAAYIEGLSNAEQIVLNRRLLSNTLDALEGVGAPLRHVTLYQGMKYYGANLGRFRTPAYEDDPRLPLKHFYYAQQDLLEERARRDSFTFTLLRPEGVWGYAQGTPMNLLMAIAAYVAITKYLGVPLRFPGAWKTYQDVIYQSTDAQLLARATIWAGRAPTAANQAFNITNGDVYRWSHMFEAIADHYGLELAEPQEMSLADQMPEHENTWNEIVAKNGLVPTSWNHLVDWRFADFIFGSDFDNISSTIKIRQAGFGECFDSITRMLHLLDELAAQKIVPLADA